MFSVSYKALFSCVSFPPALLGSLNSFVFPQFLPPVLQELATVFMSSSDIRYRGPQMETFFSYLVTEIGTKGINIVALADIISHPV